MLRLGLVCLFKREPIHFRRATARHMGKFSRGQQLEALASRCRHNAEALMQALQWCARHGVGAFRLNSQILPLKTHPEVGYEMAELPESGAIVELFRRCGAFAREHNIRTSLHPDQFVLLSSPSEDVTRRSLADLDYQAMVAEWTNADVINLHAGGGYGDKPAALDRVRRRIEALPDAVRSRLTIENDDRVYAPHELLSLCHDMQIPLCYDVHHHRCLGLDEMSVERVTEAALATWNREPLFHVSSPRTGEAHAGNCYHADYIAAEDVPIAWRALDITLDVEAKAKELAVLRLREDLRERGREMDLTPPRNR